MNCAAVVMAAGNSTRMQRPKVLLPFNGVTVIEHIVSTIAQSSLATTIVVVGKEGPAIRTVLGNSNATVIDNPTYDEGMLSSVRVGVSAIPDTIDACLICLGDQPAIQGSVIDAVVAQGTRDLSLIVVPAYDGKRGHPLFIPREYFAQILSSYDDTGLRGLLQEFETSVHTLPVDESWILDDMDYPEDYQRELRRLENNE